jgi:putative transposase
MPDYRRYYVEGGTYFFTVVTYLRKPIFLQSTARSILHWVWEDVNKRFPFRTIGLCLLPEHLHCAWTLPAGDSNYSMRWKEIKRLFTNEYSALMGLSETKNKSREKRNESTIWQRRFWEHTVRDDEDLARILDYIHYNPVKHGLVNSVSEWKWSSFHR